ncbi:MAG TPA: carbohydrate porin [Burkholderiales bacterium]|nr:carbohydrate porin [Burkholderiales bacterium]
MFNRNVIAAAVALACAGPAHGQESELAKIREEIKQMKEGYEKRIEALEKRLAEAESKAGQAEQSAARAETAATQATSRPAADNAFNPALSVILQGTAARTSQDPNTFQITGFAPTGGEVGPPKRGFSLGESELFLTANVDPYFRGQLVASFTPENDLEVEEAFFQTLALGKGFTLKGGRFLSGIGYLNEIHQHAWDFQDAPLAYKAFLGGRLADDGVQLKWVAPTDLLIEVGGELGRGLNFPGTDRSKNGTGAWSLFGHVGGDIGTSTAWRAGLSYYQTKAENRAFQDVDSLGGPVIQSFTGDSKLWIADFVVKWAPNGNATYTNFKLQGEYFRRKESGSLTFNDAVQAVPQFGTAFTDFYSSRQSGWYLQGVYQFMPRWRVGYRYDRLNFGTVNNGIVLNGLGPTAADFPLLMTDHNPSRHTLMFDWSLTEFSRLRLQLAQDKSRVGVTDNQILLQYIYSLGPHGAHKF